MDSTPTPESQPEHGAQARQLVDLTAHVGRPVKLPECAAFASPRCKTCRGSGIYVTVVGKDRTQRVCLCALKRFLKAQGSAVVQVRVVGGRTDFFWAPGREPAEKMAA